MALDLRTNEEKWNDDNNFPNQTLNTELNLFKEKPELISYEQGKDFYWYSSVHHLQLENLN